MMLLSCVLLFAFANAQTTTSTISEILAAQKDTLMKIVENGPHFDPMQTELGQTTPDHLVVADLLDQHRTLQITLDETLNEIIAALVAGNSTAFQVALVKLENQLTSTTSTTTTTLIDDCASSPEATALRDSLSTFISNPLLSNLDALIEIGKIVDSLGGFTQAQQDIIAQEVVLSGGCTNIQTPTTPAPTDLCGRVEFEMFDLFDYENPNGTTYTYTCPNYMQRQNITLNQHPRYPDSFLALPSIMTMDGMAEAKKVCANFTAGAMLFYNSAHDTGPTRAMDSPEIICNRTADGCDIIRSVTCMLQDPPPTAEPIAVSIVVDSREGEPITTNSIELLCTNGKWSIPAYGAAFDDVDLIGCRYNGKKHPNIFYNGTLNVEAV